MATALRIDVLEDTERLHRVRLTGELDLVEAPAALERLLDIGHSALVVDLSGLTFVDSSGFHVFARVRQELEARGDELVLVGARPWIRRLFQLLGVESWLSDAPAP